MSDARSGSLQMFNESLTDLERVRKPQVPASSEAAMMQALITQLSHVNTALDKMREALTAPPLEVPMSFTNNSPQAPTLGYNAPILVTYLQVFGVTDNNPPNGALLHLYDQDGQYEIYQIALQKTSAGPLYLPARGLTFKRSLYYAIDYVSGTGPVGTYAVAQGTKL